MKNQLTALADLLKRDPIHQEEQDADDLDEEELEVLREAGVLAHPSDKRRKSTGSRKNHILFAETTEEGECHGTTSSYAIRTEKYEARQYASANRTKQSQTDDVPMANASEDTIDLGWKVPQEDKGGKKKRRKSAAQDAEMDATELDEQREAAVVCLL